MNKLLGANWRTTTLGLLETLFLIVIAVCTLPAAVWDNPKIWGPAVALIVAKTFKDFITKDKTVTGGTVENDPPALKPGDPGVKNAATMLLVFACVGALAFLPACAYLPPVSGETPTPAQVEIGHAMDTLASAIRHAEDAGMSPAEFNAFLNTFVAPLPQAAPYVATLEFAYAGLAQAGKLTVPALENLASRYDTR